MSASLTPADLTMFVITQPTLVSVNGAIDTRIKSVSSSGGLIIQATNAQAGTYNLRLLVRSNKNVNDNVEAFIDFSVTITKWQCTPGFTAVTPALSA